MIQEMMHALERFQRFDEVARLRLAWRNLLPRTAPNEWRGEDLRDKILLINFRDEFESGFSYRFFSHVAHAAKLARKVVVVVEPRLVPTYHRTFPGLEVAETLDEVDEGAVDFVATMGLLDAAFTAGEGKPGPEFHPLIPDPAMVSRLRARYGDDRDTPLIGAFWYSSHHGKELPGLADWRAFIEATDARFVSLQYGEVEDDVAFLGRDRMIHDAEIDQLVDLDAFAAQVAALDAVVAISGTPAHVAGALGVPTVVLRDDWFRRVWPVMSDRVPWYPHLRVVGKDGRPWGKVFEDVRAVLRPMLAEAGGRA